MFLVSQLSECIILYDITTYKRINSDNKFIESSKCSFLFEHIMRMRMNKHK